MTVRLVNLKISNSIELQSSADCHITNKVSSKPLSATVFEISVNMKLRVHLNRHVIKSVRKYYRDFKFYPLGE